MKLFSILLGLAFMSGCAEHVSYRYLPNQVMLRDSRGNIVSGATVWIDQQVLAGLPYYYTRSETALRTSDDRGRARIDLQKQGGDDDQMYYFAISKAGFEPIEVKVRKSDYHGILTLDLVPKREPNQLPEPTSPSVTPAAGAAGAPSVAVAH
jgi:hypothetical protein